MFTSASRFPRLISRAALAGAAIFLAGCASVTPIGQLLDNASKYDGKTVRVQGEVTEAGGVIVGGAYQLRDDTGTLTVVTESGSPPRKGSTISVKGVFKALITLGSKSLAVLKEESRSTP
ncbi:MAG TPA: hypothetical protein VIG08_08825 [Gemmatimonadales bacterium]|jgi:hypothetical protein